MSDADPTDADPTDADPTDADPTDADPTDVGSTESQDAPQAPATTAKVPLFSIRGIISLAILIAIVGMVISDYLVKSKWVEAHDWIVKQFEEETLITRNDVQDYMRATYGVHPVDHSSRSATEYYYWKALAREFSIEILYNPEQQVQQHVRAIRYIWMENAQDVKDEEQAGESSSEGDANQNSAPGPPSDGVGGGQGGGAGGRPGGGAGGRPGGSS
jgi:hypothetical protein